MATESRVLNVAVVGLGMAGGGVVSSIEAMPITNLIGAADTNPRALERFSDKYTARRLGAR